MFSCALLVRLLAILVLFVWSVDGLQSGLVKLDGMHFTNSGRLDAVDRCFPSAPVSRRMLHDNEGNGLILWYRQYDKVLLLVWYSTISLYIQTD